jgi:hypothetical protein
MKSGIASGIGGAVPKRSRRLYPVSDGEVFVDDVFPDFWGYPGFLISSE